MRNDGLSILETGMFLSLFVGTVAQAGDFFAIRSIEVHQKSAKKDLGIWKWSENDPEHKKPKVFVPCLEIRVETAQQTEAKTLYARVRFYDANKQLIENQDAPSVAEHGKEGSYALPVLFPKSKALNLFFTLPEKLPKGWSAVVIFGDEHEAVAMVHPHGNLSAYDFPEKELVEKKTGEKVERKAAMDPVIAHVVKTQNPGQPQITLFLRPPQGVTDGSQVKGVLAMCMLANNVEDIRRQLQGIEPGKEVGGIIGFAEKHKLAILAWGSCGLWNPNAGYDEQTRQVNREMDKSFDEVAKAWELGVKQLGQKYGTPQRNFMLWGMCGAAQWAHRLALRKPDYFLAVHVHIPGSFDQPTVEANKVLWLLTTGELYGGYERAKRFYADCRKLGYPMVFKAIVGLGHAGSPAADQLGLEFFEYALNMCDQRETFEKSGKGAGCGLQQGTPQPWLKSFREPAFVGDILNQEVFPFEQQEMVPVGLRVPLPTKEIADAWNLQ